MLDCAFSGRKDLFEGLYLLTPDSGWMVLYTRLVLFLIRPYEISCHGK
ncbi:hypothetical protein [Methanospirillum purgamenti]